MTSSYRLSRVHWYGMVAGATLCFILKAGSTGLDSADFQAGFLSAILAAPFILRESQAGDKA